MVDPPPWRGDFPLQAAYLLLPLLPVPLSPLNVTVAGIAAVLCAAVLAALHPTHEIPSEGTIVAMAPDVAVPSLLRLAVRVGPPLGLAFLAAPHAGAVLCTRLAPRLLEWFPTCATYCCVLASGHLYTTHELLTFLGGHGGSDEGRPLLPLSPYHPTKPSGGGQHPGLSGVQSLTVLLAGVSFAALGVLATDTLSGSAPFGVIMGAVGTLGALRAAALLLAVGDTAPALRPSLWSRQVTGARSLLLCLLYGAVLVLVWPVHTQTPQDPEGPLVPSLRPISASCSLGLIAAVNTFGRSLSIQGALSDTSFRIATLVLAALLVNLTHWLTADAFADHTARLLTAFGLCLLGAAAVSWSPATAVRLWCNPRALVGVPWPRALLGIYGLSAVWCITTGAWMGLAAASGVWSFSQLLPPSLLLPIALYHHNELCQALETLLQTFDAAGPVRLRDHTPKERRTLAALRGVAVLYPVAAVVFLIAGGLQVTASAPVAASTLGCAAPWFAFLTLAPLLLLGAFAVGGHTGPPQEGQEVLEMTSTGPRTPKDIDDGGSMGSSATLVTTAPPIRRVVNVGQLNDDGLRALGCIQQALNPESERFRLDLLATRAVPEYGASILYQILSFNEGSLVQLLPFCEDSAKYANALRELYNTTRDGLAGVGLQLPAYGQMTELEGRELRLGIAPDRRTMFQILQEPANVWLALCNSLEDADFDSVFTNAPTARVGNSIRIARALFADAKRDMLQQVVSARNLKPRAPPSRSPISSIRTEDALLEALAREGSIELEPFARCGSPGGWSGSSRRLRSLDGEGEGEGEGEGL
jgi:hypothetical protein